MATRRSWLQWGLVAIAGLSVQAADAASPDDAAVYAAYFNAAAKRIETNGDPRPAPVLVLHPVSLVARPDDRAAQMLLRMPGSWPQTGADLSSKFERQQPVVLPLSMLDARLHVIQPLASDLDDSGATHPGQQFHERLPEHASLIRLSPVGYNRAFNQAAFVLSIDCGVLCGTGTLVRLQETATGWRVIDEKMLWIS